MNSHPVTSSRSSNAAGQSPLRVACFVPAFNAGETTRGIELCRGLVAAGLEGGREVTARLAYPTSDCDYEPQIIASGFETQRLKLHLDQATVAGIMAADHEGKEFISDLDKGRRFIRAIMDEIVAWRPDLILCGFVPPVAIAAKILKIPTVVYLPFPAYRPWVRRHLLKDIPDELDNALTSRAPKPLRQAMAKLLSLGALTSGFFRQPTFASTGRELGWRDAGADVIGMLSAPLQLVTDLPVFYEGEDVGPNTRITGPLFSRPTEVDVPPEIQSLFAVGAEDRIFVSMGSSGEKPYLLAAIEALATMQLPAVVVVPPHVCSLSEVREKIRLPSEVLLTDSFVPARQVNAMADAVIVHGGQGTVQTAISAGTPIVGMGMQPEQTRNLENVVCRGAGIRLRKREWTPENIRGAVSRVLEVQSFRESAVRLKALADATDGQQEAGRTIFDFAARSGL